MATDNGKPFGSFGFRVKIGGDEYSLFQEVSGLSASISVEEVQEGGDNSTTRKMVTGASFSNVTLKRGLCSTSFYAWIEDWLNGKYVRKDISIEMLDAKNQVVKTFALSRCIPVKWDGPSLGVMSDAIATESLEIAHEGMKIS